MIHATIDTNLVLWLVVFGWLWTGIALIILGAMGSKREEYYDGWTCLTGVGYLLLVLAVFLW